MSAIERQIESVVDTILEDYHGNRDIDLMDVSRQPDKDVIIDVIEKLRRIVFPGYFRDKTTAFTMPSTIFPCSLRM